eukprot:328143_1
MNSIKRIAMKKANRYISTSQKQNRILYVNPVGTSAFDQIIASELQQIAGQNTQYSVCSFPDNIGLPLHLEAYCYESFIAPYLLKTVEWAKLNNYDGMVIGCFYDSQLLECREISDEMIITAPCQSSCNIATSLGNTFSILVGHSK